jgi:hypothetical protein
MAQAGFSHAWLIGCSLVCEVIELLDRLMM